MSDYDNMTDEQALEYDICRIRAYALTHGMKGPDVGIFFDAGIAAAHYLRPDLFDADAKATRA